MSIEICMDLSLSLDERIKNLNVLEEYELNELIERFCSIYNMTPIYLCLEYLTYLILYDKICIHRRIRIAEMCDLYSIVLYLLHRIQDIQQQISFIELFSNKYLKIHAYNILYSKVDISTKIQIMKNLWVLNQNNSRNYMETWFLDILLSNDNEYKLRAECADFLLNHTKSIEIKYISLQFLGITIEKKYDDQKFYAHKENIHLLIPNNSVISELIKKPKCSVDEICDWLKENLYDIDFFRRRILNDKTWLNDSQTLTLEILLCIVWTELNNDLKHLLIKDLLTSRSMNESFSWSCTSGFYHRILNIYSIVNENDTNMFENTEWLRFYTYFETSMNKYINNLDEVDLESILEEFGDSYYDLNHRIKYLTFKSKFLTKILDELHMKFSNDLSDDIFDDFFQKSIRKYERLF